MNIYVVILNWNGKDDTLACLASLKEVSTPHQVVVVDNGSIDGSPQAFSKKFPHVHLIETGKNLGYAEGNNVGIRYALKHKADAIFILNNDTIVTKDILEKFLSRNAPIQGGKALLMEDPFKIDHLGGNWNGKTGRFELVGANAPSKEWAKPITMDYVCGVALFVHAHVFKAVGLFDPRFFLFWEECDWCFRAKQQGFSPQVCPEAILFHKKSASFTGGKPHTTYFWWRNRLLWIKKNCPKENLTSIKKEIFRDYLHTLKIFILKSLQYPFAKKTY
ncbi:MAG: glycosyltransferase family 2 protein, partial [Chlamydiia bacterium]|nr:glycosyltransferase family 2 protein [Chlamydiia bacterium]